MRAPANFSASENNQRRGDGENNTTQEAKKDSYVGNHPSLLAIYAASIRRAVELPGEGRRRRSSRPNNESRTSGMDRFDSVLLQK
ncbi:hypothetical protein NL676_025091 [Syzygium grande]|nr:hypothetical protein NL676_025091 [Syzygium grande]